LSGGEIVDLYVEVKWDLSLEKFCPGMSNCVLEVEVMTAEELLQRYTGGEWQFPGVDLKGTSLRGSQLRGIDLSGADLSGADLSGADLSGALLEKANLAAANLNGVMGEFSYQGAFVCRTTSPEGRHIDGPDWL
jgi:Pentapeptide repeats (8 copies)